MSFNDLHQADQIVIKTLAQFSLIVEHANAIRGGVEAAELVRGFQIPVMPVKVPVENYEMINFSKRLTTFSMEHFDKHVERLDGIYQQYAENLNGCIGQSFNVERLTDARKQMQDLWGCEVALKPVFRTMADVPRASLEVVIDFKPESKKELVITGYRIPRL